MNVNVEALIYGDRGERDWYSGRRYRLWIVEPFPFRGRAQNNAGTIEGKKGIKYLLAYANLRPRRMMSVAFDHLIRVGSDQLAVLSFDVRFTSSRPQRPMLSIQQHATSPVRPTPPLQWHETFMPFNVQSLIDRVTWT